ncbi:carnitine dehydratase [Mesorhizobium loti]|nr:aldehyde dehydrogenase [Mesorhizobium loti]PLP59026.1 carnitine dehydratase [Mesorhizobium loti]
MSERFELFIDNQFVAPSAARYFPTDNPAMGKPWAEVAAAGTDDIDRAVRSAHRAFKAPGWAAMTASDRGVLLNRLADLVARDAEALAVAEVRDNGKLLAEMKGQMAYMPRWFRYYAGLADKVEGAVLPSDKKNMVSMTRLEPLGVVAAIVPWNSPLLLTSWKLAPALAAGNTVVIKPSEYTSTSIAHFARLVVEAGFPQGVVNVVTGTGAETGAALVSHPLVRAVAFTGGEAAGIAIAETAARRLIPVTLELGGKSANVVFADADLDRAAKGVVGGIFAATGQTCVAGSRLLVHQSVKDELTSRIIDLARTARMGDPMSLDTHVGPVTTRPQLDKIMAHIDRARAEGAECLLGGKRGTVPGHEDGWFVEPTIFDGVASASRLAREEVFGPVLAIMPFDEEEEAVEIANSTDYGLAAGLWTRDLNRAHRISQALEAGSVWVNTYRTSAPMAPFGGYKRSGLGREGGQDAIRQFLQAKSIWIDLNDEAPPPFVMRL